LSGEIRVALLFSTVTSIPHAAEQYLQKVYTVELIVFERTATRRAP
jgi:hypothetical protein